MSLTQKIIHAGFAACALASASMPAMSWTVWPNVDFEWYANVGKQPASTADVQLTQAPRAGHIWAPGHYARAPGGMQQWVPGRWVKDDYHEQVARYNVGPGQQLATGPTTLYDRQGNPIPTSPDAYPIDSSRR